MANVMSMTQVSNKPSRNGFDLSFKKNFTAKAGELLPVMVKEVIPGDKFTIDLKAMTRTKPVNTAAFARIREYYDFYYVPYSCLWNRANSVLTQMNFNQMHATGLTAFDNVYSGELPYITIEQIVNYLNSLNLASQDITKTNYFGYERAPLSVKLLEYLGYGNYDGAIAGEGATVSFNGQVNVMGLLAYQKIYADFFRDEQWEKPSPSTFNVDYMDGTGSMQVNIPTSNTDSFFTNYNWFDMRYCNWQKDLYHGLLPHAQYGDTTVVPLSSDGFSVVPNGNTFAVSSNEVPPGNLEGKTVALDSVSGDLSKYRLAVSGTGYTLISDTSQPAPYSISNDSLSGFTILALRQYEFLQKWKEIVQSTGQNFKDQIKKIWNVDVSQHLSHKCRYLGGISSSLDINEVVNTNITGENGADIAGKGVGISNGQLTFESDGQFGLIMCIYHALPLVDYTVDYLNPEYLRINAEDFANPVFDRVGMQSVNTASIMPQMSRSSLPATPTLLGYAPRYVDYKTSIDLSVGDFKRTLQNWVLAYNFDSFRKSINSDGQGDLPQSDPSTFVDYSFFKMNPAVLNPIFAQEVDSSMTTDQFLCSAFFDVKVARNLDVDGLPY